MHWMSRMRIAVRAALSNGVDVFLHRNIGVF